MPKDVLESILEMLGAADPELQCAAARVIGELGIATEDVVRRVARLLDEGPALSREYALQTLGRLRKPSALAHVVKALAQPEPLRGKVREILVSAGPDVLEWLAPHLEKKDAGMRRAVVDTLGAMRSKESLDLLMQCMKDEDYEIVKTATGLVRGRIDAMTDPERHEVCRRCARLLKSAEAKKNRHATVSALRLLGHLRDPDGAALLLDFVGPKQPAQVRANALLSLGTVPVPEKLADRAAAALLPLLEDEDFANVVQHAIPALSRLPVPKGGEKKLEKLLASPHQNVRLFAMRALGSTGSKAAVGRLLALLDHADAKEAEEAARALQNPAFAKPVLEAYAKFATPQRGWTLVNVLKAQGTRLEGPARLAAGKRLLAAIEAGKEEFKIHFELLRYADPERLRDMLLEKGRKLRQAHKAAEALTYLALVNRDDLLTPEVQYQVALARLDTMNLDVTRASSDPQSPTIQIAALLRNPDFPLIQRLKTDKPQVSPAALLYLGYRFTERAGAEREFGGAVLKLLADQHAQSAEGKTARQKLRTEGLE